MKTSRQKVLFFIALLLTTHLIAIEADAKSIGRMIQEMHVYFYAEKHESFLFLFLGLMGVIGGALLLLTGNPLFKGIAIPLILIGVIQFIVGATIYFRTDKQFSTLQQLVQTDACKYKNNEIQRMNKVNRSFDIYKIIEIVLLLAGIALCIFYRQRSNLLLGIGIGLSVQSLLCLILDFFAENRAHVYTEQIRQLFC